MPRLVLCEPTELYNILNQVTKLSRLTEPNYLCLLDVRSKREYDESHVITALHVKKKMNEYLLPESVDLECVKYCVVYDNSTSTLEVLFDDDDGSDSDSAGKDVMPQAAIQYGRILTRLTCHPVYILKGGYERFSGMYHFFRTQKIIWMPQVGQNAEHSFAGEADKLLHIQIEDSPEAQILPFLRHLCHFIGIHLQLGSVILIFSTRGISRSCAAAIAYLMHCNEQTLQAGLELQARPHQSAGITDVGHGAQLEAVF
uniref:Serine/threonine/tyrosine interacting like 1 n=1 Tax=Aotus nancymaae TaxID=37293 RepID=A0A2K5D0V9_AOTNA